MPISAKMVTRCLAKAKTLFCFGVFPRLCFNAVFDLNAVIKQKKTPSFTWNAFLRIARKQSCLF